MYLPVDKKTNKKGSFIEKKGPMPYNSNNQKGQYSSVYKNMKDMQNNANNDFWSTKSFENTLKIFNFDYELMSAYRKSNEKTACKVTIEDVKNFFQYIEWLIEYADDFADSSVNKLELYKTVDKLKLYRKHIKDMYYKQYKDSPDLKNVYLEEKSELGKLDVFEPGVKVIAPKEEDRTAELRLIGLDTDEYNIFCSVNDESDKDKLDKDKRDKYDSATNKINKYKENLTKQPVYDAEKSAAAKRYFANDTTLNVNAPDITKDGGQKVRKIFLKLFYKDIKDVVNDYVRNDYDNMIIAEFIFDEDSECVTNSDENIKNGKVVDEDVKKFLELKPDENMDLSNLDKYIFKKSGLLKELLGKSRKDAEDEKWNNIQKNLKFLYLYDLLQSDEKEKILNNELLNSLYNIICNASDIDSYKIDNMKDNMIDKYIIDKLKEPLFKEDDPSASDINQSEMGDCYFLAALISLINHDDYGPSFIRGMMRDNKDGTVTVRLYRSSWDEINTKDWSDLTSVDSHPVHVRVPKTGQINNTESALWVQILEKAYALVRGNDFEEKVDKKVDAQSKKDYRDKLGIKTVSSLDRGHGVYALKILTGKTTIRNKKVNNLYVLAKLAENCVCTVSFTDDFKLNTTNGKSIKIISHHTYSLTKEQNSTKDEGYVLINPWYGYQNIEFDLIYNSANYKDFFTNLKAIDRIL